MKRNYILELFTTLRNELKDMGDVAKGEFRSGMKHLNKIFIFRERKFVFRIIMQLLPKLFVIFAMLAHVIYFEYLAYIEDYPCHEWWQQRYHLKSYVTGDGEMQYVPISEKAEAYDFKATMLKIGYTILGVSFFIPDIVARANYLYEKMSNVSLLTRKITEDNLFIPDSEKSKILVKYIRDNFDVTSQVMEHFFFEEKNPRASGIVKMVFNPLKNDMTFIEKTMADDDKLELKIETLTNRKLAKQLYLNYLANNKNVTISNHAVTKRRSSIDINEWKREGFTILKLSSRGISRTFEKKLLKKLLKLHCITGRINVPSSDLAFMSAEEIIDCVQPL